MTIEQPNCIAICDRCGLRYETPKTELEAALDYIHSNGWTTYEILYPEVASSDIAALCPNCGDDFVDFLAGKSVDKIPKE